MYKASHSSAKVRHYPKAQQPATRAKTQQVSCLRSPTVPPIRRDLKFHGAGYGAARFAGPLGYPRDRTWHREEYEIRGRRTCYKGTPSSPGRRYLDGASEQTPRSTDDVHHESGHVPGYPLFKAALGDADGQCSASHRNFKSSSAPRAALRSRVSVLAARSTATTAEGITSPLYSIGSVFSYSTSMPFNCSTMKW